MRHIGPDEITLAGRCYRRFATRLPSHVDRESFYGAALEALVKAARDYDDARGVAFSTFAYGRMWHEMLDESRRQAGNSRGAAKALADGKPYIIRRNNGRTVEQPFVYEVPIDVPLGDGGLSIADTLAAPLDEATSVVERLDARRRLARMPARSRFIAFAIGCGFSQEDLAELLGVSRARISQLWQHGRARAAA